MQGQHHGHDEVQLITKQTELLMMEEARAKTVAAALEEKLKEKAMLNYLES